MNIYACLCMFIHFNTYSCIKHFLLKFAFDINSENILQIYMRDNARIFIILEYLLFFGYVRYNNSIFIVIKIEDY